MNDHINTSYTKFQAVGHPPQHTVNLETSSSYNHDIYYNMTIKGIIKIYIFIYKPVPTCVYRCLRVTGPLSSPTQAGKPRQQRIIRTPPS